MATESAVDVVVVGGGVIGLTAAWEASEAGHTVAVVDPRPGRGASWAAAGMLAPVGEAHFGEHALTELNLAAAAAWPEFARRLEEASGRPLGYRPDGSLLVAVDHSDRAATDDLLAYRTELGLAVRRLSARQCRELEPLLAPGVSGGAALDDDHQVDNRLLVDALVIALGRRGVRLVDDEVAGVVSDPERVTGVDLRHGGRLAAGAVVVAAGCYSGQVGGIPSRFRPPVRPVKGLTLRLGKPGTEPSLRRTVRGLVRGRTCYLVPRHDGTVVVGATVEERGFDLTVQAGSVGDLLDDARLLVPALEEYELTDTTTGLRPGSPDNGPIVGRSGPAGLILATGHYRNGILLAPITAAEVVRLLRSPAVPSSPGGPAGTFAAFRPDRFAGPADRQSGSADVGRSPGGVR